MKRASQPIEIGDQVIWWKRVPDGDYVFPVSATVLALTAKRVKIEVDDDGEIVIRYAPPEAWQYQFWPSQRATAFGDMHIQLDGSRPALPLDCAAAPGKRHNPKSTA
jgi:hypothetical protein